MHQVVDRKAKVELSKPEHLEADRTAQIVVDHIVLLVDHMGLRELQVVDTLDRQVEVQLVERHLDLQQKWTVQYGLRFKLWELLKWENVAKNNFIFLMC